MKVSPGGLYWVLALALLAASTSNKEPGKIGKFLHPCCLQVHKVQYCFAI